MYHKEDIRVGSLVIAAGRSGDTWYEVVSIGTKLLGEDSFLGKDLREGTTSGAGILQVLSCSLIKSIYRY